MSPNLAFRRPESESESERSRVGNSWEKREEAGSEKEFELLFFSPFVFGFVRVTTYAATQISHVQRVSPTCQFPVKLQARENAVISVFYSLFASERCP